MTQHSITLTEKIGGDWSIAGIALQAKPLTELSNRCHEATRTVALDCGDIKSIDLSGFQLLYVWMHCLHLKGLQPKLVNVPDFMRESQRRLGIAPLFDSQENRS
jgi:ABC-type transporter Mla MlaB component